MQNNHQTLTSAGKIIILGEHSVVYGAPALALPLDGAVYANFKVRDDHQIKLFASTEEIHDPLVKRALSKLRSLTDAPGFNLTITSNKLPVGSGLGSSAALSYLLAQTALRLERNRQPELRLVHTLTHELEKVFHSNSSGIDDTVVCHQKPVIFQKEGYANSPQLQGKHFNQEIFFPELYLPDTLQFSIGCSKTSSSTRKMVKLLKKRLVSENKLNDFKNKMKFIFNEAMLHWKHNDFIAFGKNLAFVHSDYKQLGISTPQLDDIVETALNLGALGAKLSGSGGGGCAIILHEKKKQASLKKELQKRGYLVINSGSINSLS